MAKTQIMKDEDRPEELGKSPGTSVELGKPGATVTLGKTQKAEIGLRDDEHEDDEQDDEGQDEGGEDEGDEDAASAHEEDDVDDTEYEDEEGHGHDADDFDDDETSDPTWWAPYAVMGSLILVGLLGFFGVFNKALGFLAAKPKTAAPETTSVAVAPATPPVTPRPSASMQRPAPQKRTGEFGAKHLLVQYKGSMRAGPQVSRTKDEAKARAEEALKKLKGGGDWKAIVAEYSDEPGAGQREGELGEFNKGMMHPDFQAGVEATKVGELSGLVESPFGYHVLKRTK
jgi:hypothetical protein